MPEQNNQTAIMEASTFYRSAKMNEPNGVILQGFR